MSRGPGQIEQRIGELFAANRNRALSIGDLCDHVFALDGSPPPASVAPRPGAACGTDLNMQHGPRMTIGNTAVVRLQPVPKVMVGTLSADDRQALFQWIAMNEAVLLDFWHCVQLGRQLRPLSPPIPP